MWKNWWPRDHPRACGEQGSVDRPGEGQVGSPPRVRGTGRCPAWRWPGRRITPARAGNRPMIHQALTQQRDHPRACGEQVQHLGLISHGQGSPPRVRGTDALAASAADLYGITPARAGNSPRRPFPRLGSGDHPRACGEQLPSCKMYRFFMGSPPRVRGTDHRYRSVYSMEGITPARAGNSIFYSLDYSYLKDHPRACGEQSMH